MEDGRDIKRHIPISGSTFVNKCFDSRIFTPNAWIILYNKSINPQSFMTQLSNRIANRILEVDNFENVAHVCCDWEEFVIEVAEWGVQSIAKVDFDDLNAEDIKALDEFIASFGCSPSQPHPCSKYADPIFI